jgi:transcription initiation factor TFIIIB Brf1 subunit/transcription initiation factor TFIIB
MVVGQLYYQPQYFLSDKEEEDSSSSPTSTTTTTATTSPSSTPPSPPPPPLPVFVAHQTDPIELIKHVCANANICDSVGDYAISIMKTTVNLNTNKKINSNRKIEAIAAYAVYAAGVKMNCPRQMEEIANSFNITVRQIWEVQKLMAHTGNAPEVKAVDYVNRYCSLLELEYPDCLVIIKLASCVKLKKKVGSIKSSCLIAVIIYLYCKEKNIALPLKKILQVCGGISATSVFRAIRKIDKDHVSKITLLL